MKDVNINIKDNQASTVIYYCKSKDPINYLIERNMKYFCDLT